MMYEILRKPLRDILITDVCEFIRAKPGENEQVEFKRLGDPREEGVIEWLDRQGEVQLSIRKNVLKEICAFANTRGGVLFIGVDETDEKPHAAKALVLLAKCHDLAERLRRCMDSCVKPPLASVEVSGISANDVGDGIVIIRVSSSRNAPHRVEIDKVKECYVRRADNSMPMTMREIQDVTLNVARGLAAIEKRMDNWREAFALHGFSHAQEQAKRVVGIGCIATPLDSSVYLDNVYGDDDVMPRWRPIRAQIGESTARLEAFLHCFDSTRPMLRGAVMPGDRMSGMAAKVSVECDGTVQFEYYSGETHEDHVYVYRDYLIQPVCNVLDMIDRFRVKAGHPSAEYALQIVVSGFIPGALKEGAQVFLHHQGTYTERRPLEPIPLQPPPYPIQGRDGFDDVLSLVYRDLYSSAAWHIPLGQRVVVYGVD